MQAHTLINCREAGVHKGLGGLSSVQADRARELGGGAEGLAIKHLNPGSRHFPPVSFFGLDFSFLFYF